MTAPAPSVLVIGGGPAGLTATYRLTQRGYHVTLVDRCATPGGPASGLPFPATILGCHQATWALLEALYQNNTEYRGIDIPLEIHLGNGRIVRYPDTWFPGPFRPFLNLLRWSAIPWNERRQLISWLERIWEGETELPTNLEQRTAEDWLRSLGQTAHSRQAVWNPLARWLTGTDLQIVSADSFVATLRPFFLGSRADNRLTLFSDSLQEILLQPLARAAVQAGATVRFETEATHFRYEQDRVVGVQLRDGSILEADWYVTAISPQALRALLPERWLSRFAYFQQLAELTTIEQAIIQGIASTPTARPRLMLLSDQPDNSVLIITGNNKQTCFTLVMTGLQAEPEQHPTAAAVKLTEFLRSRRLLPTEAVLTTTNRHTIPHAVLALAPGTKTLRPIQRSPVGNLLVAGAWTDTGWPCNLESAIESGNRCAWAIQGQ